MSVRTVPTRLAVAAAGLALVLGVAACGGSDGDGAAPSSQPTAAAGTSAAGPTTVAAAFDRAATAASEQKSVKGSLSTQMPVGKIEGEFEFAFQDTGTLASFSFDQAGQKVEGIITPKTIYLGGGSIPVPSGKKYLRIEVGEDNDISKAYGPLAASVTKASDFSEAVAQWKGLSNLKAVGTEKVDGVTATKYTGSIDPKNPPANASQAVKDSYASLASAGITAVNTTIWIGPEGLPHKVVTQSIGGQAASTSTVTYRDWGGAVTVKVPSSAESGVYGGVELAG